MSKEVILTGLRANNDLHIGNYLGALLPMIDMAKQKAGEYQVNLFVPDLHSFTTPIDHGTLQEAIMNNIRVYAAAGLPLDNPNVHIYRQSYIPAHSELTWILDCFTAFDEMTRMTQFKDKSASLTDDNFKIRQSAKVFDRFASDYVRHGRIEDKIKEFERLETAEELKTAIKDYLHASAVRGHEVFNTFQSITGSQSGPQNKRVSVGLFNYPVLMAADILLYNATYVPVGDDQTQHLEFSRDIAERMNSQFGELFTVPKPVKDQHKFFGKDQGLRVKDLADPSKKMSKSDETGKGVIFLNDTPDVARKKVMSATTDSLGQINYDYENQPGVSSLLDLLALLKGVDQQVVIDQYKGQTMYGPLKAEVADVVANFLSDFQTKLAAVDDKALLAKLDADEKLMNEQANETLLKVQKAVGLR